MPSKINESNKSGFQGLTVAAFESRQSREMEDLISRHGGRPMVAPSMREIPLSENKQAFEVFEKIQEKHFDVIILMTGVGTRALFHVLEGKFPPSHIKTAMKRLALVARGPKSVKALTEYELKATYVVPEPNTWREVLTTLEEHDALKGKRIVVQEYGVSNQEMLEALEAGGAKEVVSLPVYRWALPEDTKPLAKLIESIIEGVVPVALFTSAQQIHNTMEVARGLGLEEKLRGALARMVIGSVGAIASEALKSQGLTVDVEPEHPKMGFLVKEVAEKCHELHEKKETAVPLEVTPRVAPKEPVTSLKDSLFLKACRKEKTDRTPLWIMRQAGRYLPEYREIRSTVSFLTLCKRPDLAAKVTVSAQEVLGVDAAILFADILLIGEPMGFNLEFADHGGPVIRNPLREAADIKRVKEVDGAKDLSYVMDAVRLIRRDLKPHIPLIGFAGAPFTLASYLIEGGGSKDFYQIRKVLAEQPELWDDFMKRIVAATISYLNAQVAAGAQALQLFDSWVGILSPEEFKKFALPYVKLLISGLKPGVPVIYFGTETAPFYPLLKSTGASVVGVDWRTDLGQAWKELGDVAIQGNLNPEVLLTNPDNVRKETEKVLKSAAGKPGHIFNLGHGILPATPMENVRAMIETVKGWKPT